MAAFSWIDIEDSATWFSKKWAETKGKERQQAQTFIREFLAIFGITDPFENNGEFEHKCPKDIGDDGYIDYFLPSKLIVEMKTKGKDLTKAYAQLKDYVIHLPSEQMPELMLVCDFDTFELYHRTTAKHISFRLKELRKYIRHFAILAGYETQRVYDEQDDVNVQAALKMAKLHDELKKHGIIGHKLEVYLVRLLFCMFAEDTGIFPKDAFLNYNDNAKSDGTDLSARLNLLFEVLDMPPEIRAMRTLLSADVLQFAYVDGGLFSELLGNAEFNQFMKSLLIECCKFDWSKISPAIFGSMFQGIMDPEQRREIGAHYTSEDNILKVINPLFMNELWSEFDNVKTVPKKLEAFHQKIANLRFLDPACGCGNFLITTYKELRRLEFEIIKMKYPTRQRLLDISPLIKVSIEQFYGIEILKFPCEVARTGMWLVEHLMNREVGEWFGMAYADLPLKRSAHIYYTNALRVDWQELLRDDKDYHSKTRSTELKFDYIIGNPPYCGRRYRNAEQIEDVSRLFAYKDIDYVACWFKTASKYIHDINKNAKCAFVSTNSITQGEQVSALWKDVVEKYNISIEFAYRTFKWRNEGKHIAAVHCVIIGFGDNQCHVQCKIYVNRSDATVPIAAKQINGYLLDAPFVFIDVRNKPLCDVPPMKNGNVPLDGDALKVEESELVTFAGCPWIKRLMGGRELLHNEKRYVIWLVGVSPKDIKNNHEVYKRVELCRNNRLAMKDKGTQKLAEKPSLFRDTNNPDNYIALPMVSSETRQYLPMAFLHQDVIPTNQIQTIENATLYHFGILTSSVHMAWMRTVCGRLEMRYRYSKDIVYNNFPWPDLSGADGIGSAKRKAKESTEDYQKRQEARIILCTEEILRVRDDHSDCSLADLYDPVSMPPALRDAHKSLDKVVMELYGYTSQMDEDEIVADLMIRYQKLIEAEKKLSTEKKANKKH